MQHVLAFLNALHANNNREWFYAHHDDYLEAREEFQTFASQLIEAITSYDPSVAGLTLPDATYRINRDIRFSPDKSPYKTHMGVYVCRGGKKSGYSGYYFHIAATADTAFGFHTHCLAAGNYYCEPEVLQLLREDIVDNYADFQGMLSMASDYHLDDSFCLKRVPRGFDASLPCADYLKYKVYCLVKGVPTSFVTAPNLVERVTDAFRPTKPFIDFLNRALDYTRETKRRTNE